MLINETERLMRQRALELAVGGQWTGATLSEVVGCADAYYAFLSGTAAPKVKRVWGKKAKVVKIAAPVGRPKKKRPYTKRSAYWQTVGK